MEKEKLETRDGVWAGLQFDDSFCVLFFLPMTKFSRNERRRELPQGQERQVEPDVLVQAVRRDRPRGQELHRRQAHGPRRGRRGRRRRDRAPPVPHPAGNASCLRNRRRIQLGLV